MLPVLFPGFNEAKHASRVALASPTNASTLDLHVELLAARLVIRLEP
jgi:hypothetical protein